MLSRIAAILGWLRRLAASRSDLLVENLALRQQLAILTAKRPRPRMRAADRFFWVALRRFWPRWTTPSMRTADSKPDRNAEIDHHPRIGGLHYRYEWRQAA